MLLSDPPYTDVFMALALILVVLSFCVIIGTHLCIRLIMLPPNISLHPFILHSPGVIARTRLRPKDTGAPESKRSKVAEEGAGDVELAARADDDEEDVVSSPFHSSPPARMRRGGGAAAYGPVPGAGD